MSINMWHRGALVEATAGLSMPISAVQVQAHAIYRCAKECPEALNSEGILSEIERLEKAMDALRDALALVPAKPALSLVAAE